MIHIRRLLQFSLLQAFLTVGVLKDEAFAKRLPSATVTALCRGSAHLATTCVTRRLRFGFDFGVTLGAGFGVPFTVALSSGDGRVASWVGAKGKQRHGSEEEKRWPHVQ